MMAFAKHGRSSSSLLGKPRAQHLNSSSKWLRVVFILRIHGILKRFDLTVTVVGDVVLALELRGIL
jgi:hypothetical protein